MIDGKLFYDRLKKLESEMRLLKTAHIKTATTISTLSKTTGINFNLVLDDLTGTVFSDKRAIITATTTDGTDMISACYLDGMTVALLDERNIKIERLKASDGMVKFGVVVVNGNAQDWNTLWSGGTVRLNYNIMVVGSSNFNLNVRYADFDGGTG